MDRKLGRLIFLLMVVGCVDKEKIITDKVSDGLSDPMSAQFKDVRYFIDESNTLGCGQVNAKNKMGGYVGFTPFMYWQNQIRFAGESDASPDSILVCCLETMSALEKSIKSGASEAVRQTCTSSMTTPFNF